jgi:death-on-curing protein
VRYLTIDEVIALHDRVLADYGGLAGIRSHEALASAVAAPQRSAFQEDAYATLPDQAAALAFFLVMNHPFVDGNKRTGLVALETFVELNGWTLTADDDTVVNVWSRLARGDVEPAAFFAWVNSHLDQRPATPPTDV